MLSRWLRNVSIKNKLVIIVMVGILSALVASGIAFVIIDRVNFKNAMVRNMETLADVVGSNCTASLAFDNRKDAIETLSGLVAEKHIIAAYVLTKNGESFASYMRAGQEIQYYSPKFNKYGYIFEKDRVIFHRPIMLEKEIIGDIILIADLEELQTRLRSNFAFVCIITLITALVTLAIIIRMQKIISQPILRLSDLAEQISRSKDYTLRANSVSRDEIGKLVQAFNEMLSEIHERDLQLLVARDNLEEHVKARTAELEKEIIERRRAEEKIRASLEEKEVLLKEIHHRVKNNLQVITSLLNLQSSKIKDPVTQGMFRDSQGRVKSMALIHEKLYRSSDLSQINFAEYADNLTRFLLTSFKSDNCAIRVLNLAEPINLSIDIAVPCGLILNELVSNSLKHAFPNCQNGQITIKFYRIGDNEFALKVMDNGVGFPAGIDFTKTTSLGMQLVNTLTSQMDGKIELSRGNETEFTIIFPESKQKQARVAHVA